MASNEAVVSDDILTALAKKIQNDTMDDLGKELGFHAVDIERYVATNSQDQNATGYGTLAMLQVWASKQRKAAALKNALKNAGLVGLVPELFPIGGTGLLPSTENFDDILVAVAKRVRKNSEINELGEKLGFSPADVHNYKATNCRTLHVTYDGSLRMLRDWRSGQTNSTERGALKTALEQSGQIRLAEDLFPYSP